MGDGGGGQGRERGAIGGKPGAGLLQYVKAAKPGRGQVKEVVVYLKDDGISGELQEEKYVG